MLNKKEIDLITQLLYKAHKNQLLTIIQFIELFPLKCKMSNDEYCEYSNDKRISGIVKYLVKRG